MADLASIRSKYPQYDDLSDEQLVQGLHKKYYSDMPQDVFLQKTGLVSAPTLGEKFVGGLSKLIPFRLGDELAAGAATMADPALESQSFGARILDAALRKEPQGQQFSDIYEHKLAKVRAGADAFSRENPVTGGVADVLGVFTTPLPNVVGKVGNSTGGMFTRAANLLKKTGAAAAEAGALGGLTGFGEAEGGLEQRLASAGQAAESGAKFGAALGGPLAAASIFAPEIREAGKAMQRSSLGLRGSDYKKALEDVGVWDVADGAVRSPMKDIADDLLGKGALGASSSPDKRLGAIITKQNELGKEVNAILSKADDSLVGKISPRFNRAQEYINSGRVPADMMPTYQARLDAIQQGIKDGPGSLRFLQAQKQGLGGLYEVGNDVANGFNRALYHDIQLAIEKVAPAVKPLNRELTKYNAMRPVLERTTGASDTGNLFSTAIQKLRTSGGTLTTPTMIGASLGGTAGGAPGLLAGAALGAASSPAGLSAIGGKLRNVTEAGLSGLADDVAGIAGVVSGQAPNFTASRQTSSVFSKDAPKKESVFMKKEGGSPDQISDALLDAVRKQESGGNDKAVSSVGAKGPFQLMDATGKEYHKKLGLKDAYDPFDPRQARTIAKAYLSDLLKMFDGDMTLALTAYHTGPGNVKKGKIGPVGRKYAKSVFAKM